MPNRLKRLNNPFKQKRKRKQKIDNSKFYQSKRWRKVRALFVAENPLCVKCLERDIVTPVEEVDHIIPIRLGGHKWLFSNLQSLCKSCHAKKSGREAHL